MRAPIYTGRELEDIVRCTQAMEDPRSIFVFGSNLAGIHGAGAAKAAMQHYGAMWGQGVGHRERSYAIPTKDADIETLPIAVIADYVEGFKEHARLHPHHRFIVTRVGCGLAGFTDDEIAPLFHDAPDNCELPAGWR